MEGQQQDGARTVKPKTREVQARYLQSRATPSSRVAGGQSTTGRPSLAAYHSAGWVELQLPNHSSTPLMVNTGGSASTAFTQTSSSSRRPAAAAGQSARAPSTAQRRPPLQQSAAPPQRQRAAAAPSRTELAAGRQQQRQQQQQQLVTPLPGRAAAQPEPGAVLSPGSSRSSTSCSNRAAGDAGDAPPLHTRQRGSCAGAASQQDQLLLQTPRLGRLAASLACPATDLAPGRLGLSADVAAALAGGARTGAKGAEQRRAQLEAFRLQRKLQQQAAAPRPGQAAGQQGGFKAPPPKPTLFTATAAVRGAKPGSVGVAAAAGTPQPAPVGQALLSAQLGSSEASCSPVATSLSPGATGQAAAGPGPHAPPGGSPSAFQATMAALQQPGSGGQLARHSVGRAAAGNAAARPPQVPPLQMDQLPHAAPASTPPQAARQQQQHRIPRLDFTSLGQQQPPQQGVAVGGVPHTSRRVSIAAHVPLPDATPRTARDAPAASRLPKTPRSGTTPAGLQQQQQQQRDTCGRSQPDPLAADLLAACADARPAPDRQQQQQHPAPRLTLQQAKQRTPPLVPALKLAGLVAAAPVDDDGGGISIGLAAAAAAASPPQGSMSARHVSAPLSSRLAGTALASSSGLSTARPATSRGTPPAASRLVAATARQLLAGTAGSLAAGPVPDSSRGGRPPGKTPRGLCGLGGALAAAVGAGGGGGAGVGGVGVAGLTPRLRAGGAAPGGRGEAEAADEVRQQLRLLRLAHLQFRHLNAALEAAAAARQAKAEKAVAAAAAAVISLSRQLSAVQQAEAGRRWRDGLRGLLARQLPQLQQWATTQAAHSSSVAALQVAAEAALSHVPLLHGASVGGAPEAPDLGLLQELLAQAAHTLAATQPALQRLLGPDLAAATSSSSAGGAAPADQADQALAVAHTRRSLRSTALLAEGLMAAADQERQLLGELTERLQQLSGLHLYANSMEVQLLQMRQAAAADC